MNRVVPPLLWVSCGRSPSSHNLRDECRRLVQVTECAPNQALRQLQAEARLAAVFDFDEPSPTCLLLMQSIKRRCPGVPIVMLTEAHSEELAVWAFRARVWNYLVKPVPLREMRANLKQLVALVSRREASQSRALERPAGLLPRGERPADERAQARNLKRVVEHIRSNCSAKLNIGELAAQCGMDRFAFSRLFHQTYGCSYREFLMRARIDRACKLLGSSNVSVTEAAGLAGFADSSYLARVFRRYLGASPKQYCARGASPTVELSDSY